MCKDSRGMEPRNKEETRGARAIRPLLPLLMLALALVAILAPAGQAQSAAESSPAAQALVSAQRTAAKEAARAARQAQQEERAAASKALREQRAAEHVPSAKLRKARSNERTNGVLLMSCTSVTWSFREFPNLPGNTVLEKIKVKGVAVPSTTFTFDGSTGTNVTPIDAPPGSYIIDAEAKWRRATANGANGGFDIHAKVTCPPNPELSVEKLQRIEGAGASYTSSEQTGEVGQTIGYEIVVSNPGNVPLTLGGFTDPRCDAGSISGGPAGGILAPATSSAYLCKHVLTAADLTVGSYANTVLLSGTPPSGEGSPQTKTSNTVVTEVKPQTTPPVEKGNEKEPEKTTTTTTTTSTTPTSGTGASNTPPPSQGKGGVLAFSAGTVPSLKGPHGCVRSSFHASVKSAGVASVIFYLDGHKLKKLTAHSAHGGLLSITINPAKLKLGAHRLVAKITMIKATTAAKAVQASRTITILRCRSTVGTPHFAG